MADCIGLAQSVNRSGAFDDRPGPMEADNAVSMPIEIGTPSCRAVSPSAPSELAWLLNLLTQTGRYAEPALAELDGSLLPGIGRLRKPIKERLSAMWNDELAGCAELMYAAHEADCVLDDDLSRLFAWLADRPTKTPPDTPL